MVLEWPYLKRQHTSYLGWPAVQVVGVRGGEQISSEKLWWRSGSGLVGGVF